MNNNLDITPSGKIENDIVLPYSLSIRRSFKESWARVSGFKATTFGAVILIIILNIVIASVLYFALGINSIQHKSPGMSGVVAFATEDVSTSSVNSTGPQDSSNPTPTVSDTASPDLSKQTLVVSEVTDNPPASLSSFSHSPQDWKIYLFNLLTFLFTFPLTFGLALLGIKRAQNVPTKALMLFNGYRFYFPLLGVIILQIITYIIVIAIAAGICVGLFMLGNHIAQSQETIMLILSIVVKAVAVIISILLVYYWIGMVIFSPYLVMDKRLGVFKSFKVSLRGFRKHGIRIIIAFILMSILLAISAIPFGIGLIWTIPLSLCLLGVIYRTVFGVTVRE